MSAKKGLGAKGMGLEALIGKGMNQIKTPVSNKDGEKIEKTGFVIEVDIDLIEPNREQPRKQFDENSLIELSESIKEYGIIQPLIVKKTNDYYQIIAGERRWRSAKIAGLNKLPVIIKDYDKGKSFEVALIENIQRENLNPMEEAVSYKRLAEEFSLSQEEISERVGKSRSAIANSLRLLNLDEKVQNFVRENKLSNGHARALLSLNDKESQFETAEKIIEEDLSVRQTEALVKLKNELANANSEEKPKKFQKSSEYTALETDLSSFFSTKVNILAKSKDKGKIEIDYYSQDDLERIITILKGKREA